MTFKLATVESKGLTVDSCDMWDVDLRNVDLQD